MEVHMGWELLQIGIGTAIMAVFLRLATRWVCKFTPPFTTAFLASLLAMGASWLAEFIGAGVLAGTLMTMGFHPVYAVVGLVILDVVVISAVYGVLVRDPLSGPIGFFRGFLVLLAQGLIATVIGLAVVGILFVVSVALSGAG
jgi:hypothetical protein